VKKCPCGSRHFWRVETEEHVYEVDAEGNPGEELEPDTNDITDASYLCPACNKTFPTWDEVPEERRTQ